MLYDGLAIKKLLWNQLATYRTLISLFNVIQLCAARKLTPFTGLNKVKIQTRIPLIPTGVRVSKMIAKIQMQIQDFGQTCIHKDISCYSLFQNYGLESEVPVNKCREGVTSTSSDLENGQKGLRIS